jgi:hypothetical protein
MGLDLVVEGCPRPGYEAEWRRLLERSFSGDETPEAERVRFGEISIPGYERIGAPRVGFDKTADDWIVESSNATPDEVPNVLKDFHGYYVLRLARCDGVPKYSNGGLYDGVDETSFRGDFLSDCAEVLSAGLIEEAWDHKFPEDAVRYGRGLLAAEAQATEAGTRRTHSEARPGLLERLGWAKKKPPSLPLEEQLDIVRAAGKWFIFWGERGHAIRAWF